MPVRFWSLTGIKLAIEIAIRITEEVNVLDFISNLELKLEIQTFKNLKDTILHIQLPALATKHDILTVINDF